MRPLVSGSYALPSSIVSGIAFSLASAAAAMRFLRVSASFFSSLFEFDGDSIICLFFKGLPSKRLPLPVNAIGFDSLPSFSCDHLSPCCNIFHLFRLVFTRRRCFLFLVGGAGADNIVLFWFGFHVICGRCEHRYICLYNRRYTVRSNFQNVDVILLVIVRNTNLIPFVIHEYVRRLFSSTALGLECRENLWSEVWTWRTSLSSETHSEFHDRALLQ